MYEEWTGAHRVSPPVPAHGSGSGLEDLKTTRNPETPTMRLRPQEKKTATATGRVFPLMLLAIVALATLSPVHPNASADIGGDLEAERLPSLMSAIRFDEPLDFCGEPVPLDDPDVREGMEKEMLLSLWDRAQVILWLKRSSRYFPVIEKRLAEEGLPDDLKYIPVAESALLPHIGSSQGAVGFWQFIRETGRRYGLTIDNDTDDRRNIFTATDAAIRYLKAMFGMTGSWTLAAAGYNMGENGLLAAMEIQQVTDYYRLYLPLETQRYIFRIVAIKQILKDPGRYGFVLTARDLYPPLAFERVTFNAIRETGITTVARAAGTDYKRIKDLNPQIRGRTLPQGEHALLVPLGAAEGFHRRFKELAGQDEGRKRVYVVQKGDSLTGIASRFNVPLASLISWNRLSADRPIHPGDRLVIYPK